MPKPNKLGSAQKENKVNTPKGANNPFPITVMLYIR